MTKEDKELLLKDLCARLPYDVNIHIKGEYHKYHKLESIDVSTELISYFENLHLYEEPLVNCKPYLRTMSSMTEEENKTYQILTPIVEVVFECDAYPLIDFLNAHHFDYRGLIKKGLALEAPEDMYKF